MSVISKLKKGSRILRSRLLPPKAEELFLLVLAVTYLCNCRCVMCNIWKKYREDSEKQNEEMTIAEIRDLFMKSNLLRHLRLVLIAGGEPFLRNDLAEIVLLLYDINPLVSIIIPTNGQSPELVEDSLRAISDGTAKRGMHTFDLVVGISLDGMEETHDRMRGRRGAFQRALETAERIRHIDGIRPGFQFTFSPQNFREFESVCELAGRMAMPLGFQFAQVSGHYYENEEQQFGWNDGQIAEIRRVLVDKGYFGIVRTELSDDGGRGRSLAHRILDCNRFFLEHVLAYQLRPQRNFPCFSGTHSCFLDPYGYVFPCITLGRSYGNVLEQDFDSLWKSPTAEAVRRSISRRECHCCSFCDIPFSLQRSWRPIPRNVKNIVLSACGRTPC